MLITLLFKKGDPNDPGNYRGISLINVLVKVFTAILCNRLSNWVATNNILPENQAGFRVARGCEDHVFTLSAVIGISLRLPQRTIFAVFVDFKRAFDSVDHRLLWLKLLQTGVSAKLIRILKNLYSRAEFQVKANGELSRPVALTEGVMQGEVMSPLLFALFLADIEDFFRSKGVSGVDVDSGTDILLLLYADDMVVLGHSAIDMNVKMDILSQYCQENKLTVNVAKTKLVCFRRAGGLKKLRVRVRFEGLELEQVSSYVYLGVPFNSSGVFCGACTNAISRSNAAAGAITSLMARAKIVSWSATKQLFEACVRSVLMYCASCWALRYSEQVERIQVGFYKRLLLLPRSTPNCLVRAEVGVLPLAFTVMKQALRWLGRVLNMPHSRYPRVCLDRMVALTRAGFGDRRYNWVTQLQGLVSACGSDLRLEDLNDVAAFRARSAVVLGHCGESLWRKDRMGVRETRYLGVELTCEYDKTAHPQEYLTLSWPYRILRPVAQLRLGGRHNQRLLVNGLVLRCNQQAHCPLCNWHEPDTFMHFLLECPLLANPRVKFLSPLIFSP